MEKKWWHKAVVYQIYPRSFNDSNGDGIGDIPGIIEKLDHIKDLGANVIWLSPVYKSPMDDNGYDISDYMDIAPEFGTMDDMDRLIKVAEEKGIKIVMDLVVNHTSDEHPWFIESRSSLDNPKRDWYIWKDPLDGKEPNNWASWFTRSSWELDELTGQYYLHLFSKKQPDLNWENPEVRKAIYEMMEYWLDKGIGGFRMDVINMIAKPSDYPDAAIFDEGVAGVEHWANNSLCHEYLREMNKEVLSKYDVFTVGETSFVTTREGRLFSDPKRKELSMIFQFEHMGVDKEAHISKKIEFSLPELKKIMSRWQEDLHGKGWNCNYWSNHDQARAVSRFGHDGEYRDVSAKMLGTTLHMMSGTPFVYQGEEVGLTNTYYDDIRDYNDLLDHHNYDILINDKNLTHDEALEYIHPFSRDNARVPIAWSSGENAGFTVGKPWLKLNDNYRIVNVENAVNNKDSVYHHYKELIKLRTDSKYSNVITYGKHELLISDHEEVYAYLREDDDTRILIVSNFSCSAVSVSLEFDMKEIIISNYDVENVDLSKLSLRAYESMVLELY